MTDQSLNAITKWNRKIHIYLGLYMLLFLWIFSISGLFLNHPDWFKHQPDRSPTEQTVQMPEAGSKTEKARALMQQLNLTGEILFQRQQKPGRFIFVAMRPHKRVFVNVDLQTNVAKLNTVKAQFTATLSSLQFAKEHTMALSRRFLFVTAYMTLALGGFLLTGCSNQSPLAPQMSDDITIAADAQKSPAKMFNVISFAPQGSNAIRLSKGAGGKSSKSSKEVNISKEKAAGKFDKDQTKTIKVKFPRGTADKDLITVHSVAFEVEKGALAEAANISMEVSSGATLADIGIVFGPSSP